MNNRSQFIGAAGQHYVAYCLSVRGIHAAITLGNASAVDLAIALPSLMAQLPCPSRQKRADEPVEQIAMARNCVSGM